MIEVPLWIFFLICLATYINLFTLISMSGRLRKNDLQTVINSQIVSRGFEDVARDIDEISKGLDRLEAIDDYKDNKK
mgnify:FL=1|tara:strand:+ start:237 stop:467 length:231 start_codon:yes stop_codon:yes gene_type:complete